MIIDAHARIGKSFDGKGLLIEEYINEMIEHSISRAVLCPNKPQSYMVEDGNEYVEDVVKSNPEKFIGALRIDPWRWDKMEIEMEGKLSRNLFQFVYLNPWEENFRVNGKEAMLVFKKASELGVSVIVETGYPWVSHITQVVDVARKFETVKIIATNAGQLDLSGSTFDDVSAAMGKVENLYLGTSGACGVQWLKNLSDKYEDRILFESNYPLMHPYLEIFRIEKGFFSDLDKKRILHENINDFLEN